MARIFAFGCSYTYGHGLSDCIVGKCNAGPVPSKLVYVNLLAEYLKFKAGSATTKSASSVD